MQIKGKVNKVWYNPKPPHALSFTSDDGKLEMARVSFFRGEFHEGPADLEIVEKFISGKKFYNLDERKAAPAPAKQESLAAYHEPTPIDESDVKRSVAEMHRSTAWLAVSNMAPRLNGKTFNWTNVLNLQRKIEADLNTLRQ